MQTKNARNPLPICERENPLPICERKEEN